MNKKAHHNKHEEHKGKHDSHEEDAPDVGEELREMYAMDEQKEKKLDMTKLEVVTQPFVRRMLIAVLLVMVAVAAGLAGSLLLNNPFGDSRNDMLTFAINVENDDVISGQETVLMVPYHNPSKIPLANLEITVHLPDTFLLTDAIPVPLERSPLTWTIGSVEPDEQGVIELHGTFYETPGTAVTIQAITRYEPANFSSPFEAIASRSILVESSTFNISMTGPDRAVPEEQYTYRIVVEQLEEAIGKNLQLSLEHGGAFVIESSEPNTNTTDAAVWTVGEIDTEQPFEIEVTGSFSSDYDATGEQEVKAVLLQQIGDGELVELNSERILTDVIASDLALSLIVNGQNGDSVLLPGDDLTVNLGVSNRGEEAAEDISIELFVDSGINRANLEGRAGIPDGDRYGNKINWDSTDMSSLESLRGSENTSIDLSIPTGETGDDTIILHAEATIGSLGGEEINRTIKSSSITIRVASDLQALSSARYYSSDGVAVGRGPLPPRVGETTTYRITWSLSNALHDVDNITMVAPIPERATWGGTVSTTDGSLNYDPVSNRVRWSLSSLNANAQQPVAVFDMHLNPEITDVGGFLDIIGTATVTATDRVADSQVSHQAAKQSTDLPNDPEAQGLGAIIDAD